VFDPEVMDDLFGAPMLIETALHERSEFLVEREPPGSGPGSPCQHRALCGVRPVLTGRRVAVAGDLTAHGARRPTQLGGAPHPNSLDDHQRYVVTTHPPD
jgi:hypothetical protein